MSDMYCATQYHCDTTMQQAAGVCMCPECEYYRCWGGMQMPMQMPQAAPAPAPTGRKYSHNPYAVPDAASSRAVVSQAQFAAPSMPPVVSPSDALAPIVANVADYDVYSTMMYPPTMQATAAPVQGYTLQEQFNAAVGAICDLACTPRGRSMLQAVLRLRQPEQTAAIYGEIMSSEQNLARMMLDGNACHVVRALIEVIEPCDACTLAGPSVMTENLILQLATTSQHTRRILQALFERFNAERFCDDIAAVLASHAQYLATTQQGCIAIMRVVDNATPHQRDSIHEKLFPVMTPLAMDPYGNYVVQHMIERGDPNLISEAVITHFLPHIVPLCCNKFASNVMEKVFYCITPAARKNLLDSILYVNNGALHILMHDSYGNFVIQASIESCNNYQEFRRIAERMRPLIHTSPYGHKIEAKLKSKRLTRSNANGMAVASAPSTPKTPSEMSAPSTPTAALTHVQSY